MFQRLPAGENQTLNPAYLHQTVAGTSDLILPIFNIHPHPCFMQMRTFLNAKFSLSTDLITLWFKNRVNKVQMRIPVYRRHPSSMKGPIPADANLSPQGQPPICPRNLPPVSTVLLQGQPLLCPWQPPSPFPDVVSGFPQTGGPPSPYSMSTWTETTGSSPSSPSSSATSPFGAMGGTAFEPPLPPVNLTTSSSTPPLDYMDSFDNMLELLLADDSPLPVTNDEPDGLDAPEAPMMPPAAAPPSPPLPILETPEAPMMRPTAAPYGWPSPPLPILEAPMAFVTALAAAPPNLPLPLPHISPYAHADLVGLISISGPIPMWDWACQIGTMPLSMTS